MELSKDQVCDLIVEYCAIPRKNWEILEELKDMRSERTIVTYVKELYMDGILHKIPVPGRPGNFYLNYAPSPQQLATGEYVTVDGTNMALKTFRVPSSVTGEGLTTYPSLDIVLKNNPLSKEIWKVCRAYFFVRSFAPQIVAAKFATERQIILALGTLLNMMETITQVLGQVMRDNTLDEHEAFIQSLGLSSDPDPMTIAKSWEIIVEAGILPGDPKALLRLAEKAKQSEE